MLFQFHSISSSLAAIGSVQLLHFSTILIFTICWEISAIISWLFNFHAKFDHCCEGGYCEHLYPNDWLLHHRVVYVISLRKHRHHTFNIEEQEEGQDHADACPLAPPRIVVEAEKDHDISNNNTRSKDDVADDPEAQVLAIPLQIILAYKQEG